MIDSILEKFALRKATIGIIGMGYVGQPLAILYAHEGFSVVGFDINGLRVDELNAGHSSIEHISDEKIIAANARGMECTTDFSRIAQADAIVLCLPTPLSKYREPDLSFVTQTCDTIAPYLRKGQLVSLESTTYPGTTEEEILPRITQYGLEIGKDIFLVYSPEREDPGNSTYSTATIPKIVGGHTDSCLELGVALYSAVIKETVPVSSTKTAEMTKLLENIQRAVNIGLVNEMKIVADKMGIDIFEVVDAAATKPFGFSPFYPGPGLGGHCIPIDPFYLTWKAREYGLHTRFIELAGEINQQMPDYVLGKLASALNARGKPLAQSRVLVLGISYKKNVDDVRESPSIRLMELVSSHGAVVSYSDPHVPRFPEMRAHSFDLISEEVTVASLEEVDAVVLATDHDTFDYDLIGRHAPLIIDSRGRYRENAEHIVRA